MQRKLPKPRHSPGDLIRFRQRKRSHLVTSPGDECWFDEDDNVIPQGTVGLVIERRWAEYEDGTADWEYNIQLPGHSIVSKGWGEYAIENLPKRGHGAS